MTECNYSSKNDGINSSRQFNSYPTSRNRTRHVKFRNIYSDDKLLNSVASSAVPAAAAMPPYMANAYHFGHMANTNHVGHMTNANHVGHRMNNFQQAFSYENLRMSSIAAVPHAFYGSSGMCSAKIPHSMNVYPKYADSSPTASYVQQTTTNHAVKSPYAYYAQQQPMTEQHMEDLTRRTAFTKNNWRQKHKEFLAMICAAKKRQADLRRAAKQRGQPAQRMPTITPSSFINSNFIQCPYCLRCFMPDAANLHIPKCASILHNKLNLMRYFAPVH